MAQIIKRHGKKQKYDQKKVYASVYAAALNSHYSEKKAEDLADKVTKKVNSFVKTKKQVTSAGIKDQVIKNIKDKDVVINYKHHLDLC